MACYGVASNVKKLLTVTGTKDKFAQHWIEIRLEKAHKMKAQLTLRRLKKSLQTSFLNGLMHSLVRN